MDKNLALETLKSFVENTDNVIMKDAVLALHPELAESEDERIRKEIIRIVDIWTGSSPVVNGIPRETLLAYLEKQKEPKQDSLTKHVYSKEDKEFIQDCANILVANNYATSAERLMSMFGWKPIKWNEEDEQWLSEVYFAIDHSMYSENERQAMRMYIDFLRSQSKPTELSEEDKLHINNAILAAEKEWGINSNTANWLRSFFLPKKTKTIEDAKPEDISATDKDKTRWSDEDEKTIDEAVKYIENYAEYVQGGFSKQHVLDVARRVDSFRPQLQPHWKPSKEQMEALFAASERNDKLGAILNSLYNDLNKKL